MEKRRVVAVTGALGVLGRSVSRKLLEEGWLVARLALNSSDGADDHAIFSGIDVGSPEGARHAVERVVAEFGRLDALVNVAGTFRWEPIENGSVETWDVLYRTNLRTALCMSQAAVPHLLKSPAASIVNVGAASAASRAAIGMGAYSASKAGLAKLTEAMSEEFKDRALRVNAVLPTIIDTPANRRDMPEADTSHWVQPGALADVVAFLLSDAARAVTGSLLLVPGSGRASRSLRDDSVDESLPNRNS